MRSGLRYIIGFVLLVIGILFVLSFVTSRTDSEPTPEVTTPQTKLTDYKSRNALLRLTISGKITADEDHRSIRITVTPSSRTVEILQGYQNVAVSSQTFGNNQAAYEAFIEALDPAGFVKERTTEGSHSEKSVCPLGRRYVYELIDQSQNVVRTWSTSCDSSAATFAGNASTVRKLFQLQIPDYSKITRGTRI